MRFGILGSLEAHSGDRQLQLGPLKQRMVLGLLLCRANSVVSVTAIAEALWGDDPPRTAHKNSQVYVSALRKMLAGDPDGQQVRLLFRSPGYVLEVGPDALDALRFHDLARVGRLAMRDGRASIAADSLEQAMQLWRGPVLPDLVSAPSIEAEAAQLLERYLAVCENWAEAKLALGQHKDLVEQIDDLARQHPFRERLRQAQMLALYRSGRQTEALAEFEAMRQSLARDLGLQPSPILARLYKSILSGDPALEADLPGPRQDVSLHPPAPVPVRLPRDVADFTGRDRQVSMLVDLLDGTSRGGTAAISGPIGVGKTALAVHCAHRLGERFTDGRVLVRLRAPDGSPRPVTDLLGDLLSRVNPTAALPEGREDRATLLRQATAGRRMLVVLDDAVSEEQVRSVLSAAGDAVAVVTSRRHLGGLESAVHIAVEPMSDATIVRMLENLVGADRVAAEPEAAQRLAAACCGLPLAARIIGAKLAGLRHLSLCQYAERLADERRLLAELTAGDLQIRSRLAVSYEDLEPNDQATLRRLGQLTDPVFDEADAAVSLGTDIVETEAAIERLIEANLVEIHTEDVAAHVERRTARYRLPPLIRAYVRESVSSSA